MKQIGFFFMIFFCWSVSVQGQGNRIKENIKYQYSCLKPFSFSSMNLNYQPATFPDGLNTNGSPFCLALAMAETTDLSLTCKRKKYELGIAFEDLFNMDWGKSQLSMLSRMKDEPAPVEEIDFNTGVSFLIRLKLSIPL